jgi:hypothetical protein
LNPLDRVIGFVSPSAGARRAKDRLAIQAYSAYEAANTQPRDRNPQGMNRGIRGADSESKAFPVWDRIATTREIMDLFRNDGGLMATILTRLTDHVVGSGIYPQARTADAKWNEQAEQYFKFRSDVMDYENRAGFAFIGAMQRLLLYDLHLRGESFGRFLSNGKLQWHEAETCMDPQDKKDWVGDDGFDLSAGGIWLGCNFRIGGAFDKSARDFYVAREDLIHAHAPIFRARQRRGIPIFAPLVPRMQQYQATVAAMQLKVLLESQQTLVVTGKGEGGRVLNDMPFGGTANDNQPRAIDKKKMDTGMLWDMPEDRDIKSMETRTPSGEHMAYMNSHLEAICACVGIPQAIAYMLVGGSYSATRGQMLAFEHTVSRLYNYTVDQSQRVWNWTIAKGIKAKEIPPAPIVERNGLMVSDWRHCEWTKPPRLTLSPLEDEKVYDAKFARGNATLTEILKGQNRERADVWNEAEIELRDAIERAKKITADTGVQVDYSHFLNKVRPGAGNPAVGTTKPKEEEVLEQ